MPTSTSAIHSAAVNRAWVQWRSLGVQATGETDPSVVDPEALIALTAELGDADARLRDASTDWCVAYGRYVNTARLRRVVADLRTPADAIGEYAATIAGAGGPSWPMATSQRPGYAFRGKARIESGVTRAQLRVRLRAAYGVNARADVLAALLDDAGREGLTVADLARRTRFTKPNIAFATEALTLAGLVVVRTSVTDRRLILASSARLLPGVRSPIRQPDWASRFKVLVVVLRLESRAALTPTVRAIEARRLLESMRDTISVEDMPKPNLEAVGMGFAESYDRWLVSLVDWFRSTK